MHRRWIHNEAKLKTVLRLLLIYCFFMISEDILRKRAIKKFVLPCQRERETVRVLLTRDSQKLTCVVGRGRDTLPVLHHCSCHHSACLSTHSFPILRDIYVLCARKSLCYFVEKILESAQDVVGRKNQMSIGRERKIVWYLLVQFINVVL